MNAVTLYADRLVPAARVVVVVHNAFLTRTNRLSKTFVTIGDIIFHRTP